MDPGAAPSRAYVAREPDTWGYTVRIFIVRRSGGLRLSLVDRMGVRLVTEQANRWRVGAHVAKAVWRPYVGWWPFSVFSATPQQVIVSVLGRSHVLAREEITRITADYVNGWPMRPGLRIEHCSGTVPAYVFIRTSLQLSQIAAGLRGLGYVVEENLE